jgi:lipoprotein-anchoring transpeptidase ErfK/SrfK
MHRRHLLRTIGAAAGAGALSALAIAQPGRTAAQPAVADFAAPMPPAQARAIVAAAQQRDYARRSALARTIGAQSPDLLPRLPSVYYSPTGQHLSDRTGFLSFWRRNGGKLIFGYPITGELVERGQIVQYFERARFEYHPEHYGTEQQVMVSLLGRDLFTGRQFPKGAPDSGERYFGETGHTLSGRFRRFWEKRGGLPIFGFPISEPFEEISPTDGQLRVTQYFERARFEHYPEDMPGFYRQMEAYNGVMLASLHEIRLSDLGRQAASARGQRVVQAPPLVGSPEWSPTIWARRMQVNLSTQWLTAFESDLPVFMAPVATGKDGFNTPTGSYAIYSKLPIQTMVGAAAGEVWNVPDIPWVQYVVGGCALHGTYWHDAWGSGARMSHGCINLNIDDANWLYEWADIGTAVDITY